jgi:hypothetical protein
MRPFLIGIKVGIGKRSYPGPVLPCVPDFAICYNYYHEAVSIFH